MGLRHTYEINQLLDRIDAMMRELEGIRRQLSKLGEPDQHSSRDTPSMAERLFRGMGEGTWEEYDSIDDFLRFSA